LSLDAAARRRYARQLLLGEIGELVPNESAVMRFAASPALRDPAAAIMGAFSAVEHLKEVLGIGAAREFPSDLTLSTEG